MPGLEAGTFLSALALAARAVFTPSRDLDRWEQGRDYPLITSGRLAHENPSWVRAAESTQLLLQPDLRRSPAIVQSA